MVRPEDKIASHISFALSLPKSPDSFRSFKLGDREARSLERLVEKFSEVKQYFPDDKSNVFPSKPLALENLQESGAKDARIMKIEKSQYDFAKKIAHQADEIYSLHLAGDDKSAADKYSDFEKMLDAERSAMLGQFRSIGEVEEAFGTFGVGSNGNPQLAVGGGAVIFVVIEIYVS